MEGNEKNLFSKLEGYAKENYLTELFAYILKKYPSIMGKFVSLIAKERPELMRKIKKQFSNPNVMTQSSYPGAIIDIELVNSKHNKILIENKIQSPEGEDQIQKYLDLDEGYVVYLTPLGGYPEPKYSRNKKSYIGHVFWEDVYLIIKKSNKESEILSQFLEYLEVNNMVPVEDLTQKEIDMGKGSFKFIKKIKDLLDRVKTEIEPRLESDFGKNEGYKTVTFYENEEYIGWWYRAKGKDWKKCRLWIGIFIENFDFEKNPLFNISFGVDNVRISKYIESKVKDNLKLLEKRGWKRAEDVSNLCYYYPIPLKRGDIKKQADKLARESIKHINELKSKENQIIRLILGRSRELNE